MILKKTELVVLGYFPGAVECCEKPNTVPGITRRGCQRNDYECKLAGLYKIGMGKGASRANWRAYE